MRERRGRGQAITEFVLLMPMFIIFLIGFVKIFAMLILVQKLEIASYYAARRWQLQSHRNQQWVTTFDGDSGGSCSGLCDQIQTQVKNYLGYNPDPVTGMSVADFLGIDTTQAQILTITRTQVWNIVKLTVPMKPITLSLSKSQTTVSGGAAGSWQQGLVLFSPKPFEVTKYVPNRDRPIAFVLPGLQ